MLRPVFRILYPSIRWRGNPMTDGRLPTRPWPHPYRPLCLTLGLDKCFWNQCLAMTERFSPKISNENGKKFANLSRKIRDGKLEFENSQLLRLTRIVFRSAVKNSSDVFREVTIFDELSIFPYARVPKFSWGQGRKRRLKLRKMG
jgi:hypothetical protein